jgi:hypothetical protein
LLFIRLSKSYNKKTFHLKYNTVESSIKPFTAFTTLLTSPLKNKKLEFNPLYYKIRKLTYLSFLPKNNNFIMYFNNVLISKRDIYKNLKGKSGVYLFINKITNKLYVGSSIILSKRMASHFYHANSNKDTNVILYRAMRKYKLENFSLAILEFCNSDIIVCSNLEKK